MSIFFSNSIRLFWWNEIKLQKKQKENYGDLLGKYLVEKISNKKVVWVRPSIFSILNFFTPIYVTAGSILAHVNRHCVVWGSGIISQQYAVKKATFLAVRGPQTRNYLVNLGYDVPEVYGDPGILLPKYFNPNVKVKYKFGIVPHYNDFKLVKDSFKDSKNITVIDLMTNDIESKTKDILSCERIVSSSLHGVIVAHAYNIPAVWQRYSNVPFGDNIKFKDYFESVKMEPYEPKILKPSNDEKEIIKLFKRYPDLPQDTVMEKLRKELMAVCPFK